jgi:hypothetical protein
VTSFGPEGRYAAATGSGGDAVAILNSSTGDVVAHISFTGGRLSATSDPVLDPAGNLLVSVTDGASLEEAVLRLAPDGTVSRATQVFPLDPASDSTQIVFSTGP